MTHRIIVPLLAVVAALVVVGSASAFECYNASRSARGNEAAAKAPALASFEEILGDPEIVGLCPDGVDHVIQGVEEAGFETDSLINFRTVMAQGLAKNGKGETLLHNGKGIDHLSGEFFGVVGQLEEEAAEICGEGD